MRFLNGLFGLVLVGVMACAGNGQSTSANWATCQARCAEYKTAQDEFTGYAASTFYHLGEVVSTIAEIDAALAGPHFDASYNTDSAMPEIKAEFDLARNAIVAARVSQYNAWLALWNEYASNTSGNRSPDDILGEAGSYQGTTYFTSWEYRATNIDRCSAEAVTNKNEVQGYVGQMSSKDTAAFSLMADAVLLLEDINAY